MNDRSTLIQSVRKNSHLWPLTEEAQNIQWLDFLRGRQFSYTPYQFSIISNELQYLQAYVKLLKCNLKEWIDDYNSTITFESCTAQDWKK